MRWNLIDFLISWLIVSVLVGLVGVGGETLFSTYYFGNLRIVGITSAVITIIVFLSMSALAGICLALAGVITYFAKLYAIYRYIRGK